MIITLGLYRFSFKWIPVTITLVAFSILARLGFWQLERAEHKQQRLTQIASYEQYRQISLDGLLQLAQKHDPTGVTVAVKGQFARQPSWLLDNKVVNGQTGYDVLLALKVSGHAKAVLVNMGWLKADYAKRDVLPTFTLPPGEVAIEGFVKAKDLASFALAPESTNRQLWPRRIQQIDLEAMEQHSGLTLYPFVLYAQQDNDHGFTHHYQPVVMPPQKHRGYALQWFLLALAVIIVFILASKQPSSENRK